MSTANLQNDTSVFRWLPIDARLVVQLDRGRLTLLVRLGREPQKGHVMGGLGNVCSCHCG